MGLCVPARDIPRFISMYQGGGLPIDRLHSQTISLDDINAGMGALAAGDVVRQIIRFC